MTHPLTRAKALQNRAFLRRLEVTGNVKLAAEQTGVFYRTMQRRKAQHLAFAQQWDAALAIATARLARGEAPPPSSKPGADLEGPRTRGGEMVTVRRRDGSLQVRRAHPGKLTRATEQRFLAVLAATCNVRLAAAAAGAQPTHFYKRRRDKGFAREWAMALDEGYARLELACLAAADPASHDHDGWRHNERPEMPPLTAREALQLMYLHHKEARLQAEPPHLKRRRGESHEAHSFRLSAMHAANMERARDQFQVAEAVRHARGEPTFLPWEPPIHLPDLAQVTGWSRRDPAKTPHHPGRALFGGWRIEDWERKRDGG